MSLPTAIENYLHLEGFSRKKKVVKRCEKLAGFLDGDDENKAGSENL